MNRSWFVSYWPLLAAALCFAGAGGVAWMSQQPARGQGDMWCSCGGPWHRGHMFDAYR